MSFVVPELVEPVKAFATALGIGLLIGMERERRPDSAAGLRTFSLVAMLGCLFALLDERSGSTWKAAMRSMRKPRKSLRSSHLADRVHTLPQ